MVPPLVQPKLDGGRIELHARFPQTWSWETIHWQELWTVVQWQDEWGVWRNVEGWQGGLDQVIADEGGRIVGKRMWWVNHSDLGKGPFRWLVYRSKVDWLIGASEPFHLPTNDGDVVGVEASLVP
jgi:hypothetical protein